MTLFDLEPQLVTRSNGSLRICVVVGTNDLAAILPTPLDSYL